MKFQAVELPLCDSTEPQGSSVEVTVTSPSRQSQGTRNSRNPAPLQTHQFIDKYVIKDRKNVNTARCAATVVQSDAKIYYLKFPSVRHGLMHSTPKRYITCLYGLKKVCQTISDSRESRTLKISSSEMHSSMIEEVEIHSPDERSAGNSPAR